MELPAEITDQLVGYCVKDIVAVIVAQAGCCEHGISLLAPCEPCQRVDVFEGDCWNDARKQWIKQDRPDG